VVVARVAAPPALLALLRQRPQRLRYWKSLVQRLRSLVSDMPDSDLPRGSLASDGKQPRCAEAGGVTGAATIWCSEMRPMGPPPPPSTPPRLDHPITVAAAPAARVNASSAKHLIYAVVSERETVVERPWFHADVARVQKA
jgi:hypothetical protein